MRKFADQFEVTREIGHALASRRRYLGMSQIELAEAVGAAWDSWLHAPDVSCVENGRTRRPFTSKRFADYCGALGWTPRQAIAASKLVAGEPVDSRENAALT